MEHRGKSFTIARAAATRAHEGLSDLLERLELMRAGLIERRRWDPRVEAEVGHVRPKQPTECRVHFLGSRRCSHESLDCVRPAAHLSAAELPRRELAGAKRGEARNRLPRVECARLAQRYGGRIVCEQRSIDKDALAERKGRVGVDSPSPRPTE